MELLKVFLGGAGGAALVAGFFAVIQWKLNRKAAKEDNAVKHEEKEKDASAAEINELKNMMERLVVADRTILYDRIKHLAKSYIKREYITVEELEDLEQMHSVYHYQLDGNGFLDGLMQTVRTLQVRAA